MLHYFKVSIPLIQEFKTSFGVQYQREAVILRYYDGEIEALGEMVSDEYPGYSYEFNDAEIIVIKKYLAPILKKTQDPEEFSKLTEHIKGHNMAKAALEMMLYDYISKKEEKPLYKFIGRTKGYADVGISIGISSIDATISTVEKAVNRGYKRIKVKIQKGHDIELLKSLRGKFPNIPLSVDANQDYTLKDLETLKKLDDFNLEYIEQPLGKDDFIGYTKLKKEIQTKICLDESIESPESAIMYIEAGIADIINLKPGRMGGIGNTLKVIDIAKKNSVGLWVGGMLETGIGRSFNISIASLEDVKLPGDTSPNDKYFLKDITMEVFTMENGRIYPFNNPGIGVTIDYPNFIQVMKDGEKIID